MLACLEPHEFRLVLVSELYTTVVAHTLLACAVKSQKLATQPGLHIGMGKGLTVTASSLACPVAGAPCERSAPALCLAAFG